MKSLLIGGPLLAALLLLAFWLWTPDRSRALLEARYLATPADMIELQGWRLHVRDSGPRDAPAIVLVHGLGSSLQTWDAWAPALSRHHRVIRFDLPGSGLSPPDPAGDYSDARSISLLLALLDRLGVQRASIVGHSIGGRIAWHFAARHPERVDRLVLVSPDGFASPGFDYGKPPELPWMLGLMRQVLPRPLLRMALASAFGDPKKLTDATLDRYDDLIRAPGGRKALLDRLGQTVLVDPRPLLAAVQAPTLLIWGERDAMIPFSNAADYLKALPTARLVQLPDIGHLVQEEDPTDSLAAVQAFLGS